MTWGELIRRLKAAGFKPGRKGDGSHVKMVHPDGREVWVSIHTKKDVGRLAHKILQDAGLK